MTSEKKTRKNIQKELFSLFVKNVAQKALPKKDTTSFKQAKKQLMKKEADWEKAQNLLEKTYAPVNDKKLESAGLSPKQFMDMLDAEAKAYKQEMKNFTLYDAGFHSPPLEKDVPQTSLFDCTDINVRICQERVCIDQLVPMRVDSIWEAAGSDADFTKLSENSFQASDFVEGSSSWNWTYHRHSHTHTGKICIWSSIELIETAKVNEIGMVFEPGFNGSNGAWAHGKDPLGLPPSWGHAKMYYRMVIKFKRPGEGWSPWLTFPRKKYLDHGPVESNVYGPVTILGAPALQAKTLSSHPVMSFPAGTQILIEAYLDYWIKANGSEGQTSVDYDMIVNPYMKIESCSYEYPEWIMIHVPDYLP